MLKPTAYRPVIAPTFSATPPKERENFLQLARKEAVVVDELDYVTIISAAVIIGSAAGLIWKFCF